ncbi:hypothetical protein ACWYXK_14180 [Janthinobacterium lividum]
MIIYSPQAKRSKNTLTLIGAILHFSALDVNARIKDSIFWIRSKCERSISTALHYCLGALDVLTRGGQIANVGNAENSAQAFHGSPVLLKKCIKAILS